MKSLLIFLLISFSAFSQEEINCQDISCGVSGGITLQKSVEFQNYSILDVTNTQDELIIQNPFNTKTRDLRLGLTNLLPTDVDINFQSTKKDNDSGSLILITDSIDELTFNSNGYAGQSFVPASYACATKIIAGDYGGSIKTAFQSRRSNDSSIPVDRCVEADLIDIQTRPHTCDSGFSQTGFNINATRWIGKRTCQGESARKMCVRKKRRVKCRWNATKQTNCCDLSSPPSVSGWTCDTNLCDSTNDGWYRDHNFTAWDNELNAEIINRGSILNVCNFYFPRVDGEITNTAFLNHWKGSFVGSSRVEDFNFDYSSLVSGISFHKIEWKLGGELTCGSGGTTCMANSGALFAAGNSWQELTSTSEFQSVIPVGNSDFLTNHLYVGCHINGLDGTVYCGLSATGAGSVPTPGSAYSYDMVSESGFGYSFRFYYINTSGTESSVVFNVGFGHH